MAREASCTRGVGGGGIGPDIVERAEQAANDLQVLIGATRERLADDDIAGEQLGAILVQPLKVRTAGS